MAKQILIVLAVSVILPILASPAHSQFAPPVKDANKAQEMSAAEMASAHGIYLPSDRQLVRGLKRARARIEAGEFTEAVVFLQELLSTGEDSFVPPSGLEASHLGLKSEVRKLLATLPPEGLSAYELQFSARARKQLKQSLESSSVEGLAEVVRQFFYTPAGREAALLLAQHRFDQGDPAGAALLYSSLIDSPQARRELEPHLSLLYATCLTAAGNQSTASEIVNEVHNHFSANNLVVAGEKVSPFQSSGNGIETISPDLSGPLQGPPKEVNWTTFAGNALRTTQRPGGRPHMRPRWRARVASHPRLENYLRLQQSVKNRSGQTAIPLSTPLAIEDIVVAKTPTKLIAVHWKTGKLIWETRSLEHSSLENLISSLDPIEIDTVSASQGKFVEQRVWNDSLAASLSSDAERVYSVRTPIHAQPTQQMIRGQLRVLGQQLISAQAATNRLSAYELASEGKLVWEVDGQRENSELAGTFFLGAPLSIDGTLYVMAELRSAIYLLALDAKTGALEWRQQLLGLERGVQLDAQRSRFGAQPSFAEGLLICPTSAGAVVAIDPLTRSLEWATVYPRDDTGLRINQLLLRHQRRSRKHPNEGHWLDGTPRIAGDRVLVTPRDGEQLLCIDLKTGDMLWKSPRIESEFLGCVSNEIALLVAAHHVEAITIADGKQAWKGKKTAFPKDVLPSGFGVLSEGVYYLPLSSGEVAAISVANGEVQYQQNPSVAEPLGNLIVHRGAIISQSPFSLDKFEQLSVFLHRTEVALSNNDRNATAKRNLGELAIAENNYRLAFESLTASLELDSDDLVTRELLAETLTVLLKTDFATYQSELPLAKELADDSAKLSTIMHIEAEGLQHSGDYVGAARIMRAIAEDISLNRSPWEIVPGHTVRSDRWIQRRIQEIWNQATPSDLAAIEKILAPRYMDSGKEFRTISENQWWLSFFAGHPESELVKLDVASRYLDQNNSLLAEIALFNLRESNNSEVRRKAQLLWDTLHELNNPETSTAHKTSRSWASHQVLASVQPNPTTIANQRSVQRSGAPQAIRIEHVEHGTKSAKKRFYIATDISELQVYDELGEHRLKIGLRGNRSLAVARGHNLNTIYGKQLGNLLFVNLGLEVIAIDTRIRDRMGFDNVLWQSSHLAFDSALPAAKGYGPDRGPYYYTSSRRRLVDQQGITSCSLGPVSSHGVVFQDRQALRCVEPATGQLLWSRTDLPSVCELFGTERRVYAKHPNSTRISVFDMTDGSLIDEIEAPKDNWLTHVGSKLAVSFADSDHHVCIQIHELDTSELLFDQKYPAGTRIQIVEPHSLAIMQPEGRFQFIDVSQARMQIDYQVPTSQPVLAHHVLSDQETVFLMAQDSEPSSNKQFQPLVSGENGHPLFSGSIHALALSTGNPCWPAPAIVRNQGLIFDQPDKSPVLSFACRQIGREKGRTTNALRMLCLDKASGRSVYRSNNRTNTLDGSFRILVKETTQPTVSLQTSAEEIRLVLSDQPIPPEPPAQAVVEDQSKPSSSLLELGRKVGNDLFEAFEKSSSFQRTLRGIALPKSNADKDVEVERKQNLNKALP